MAFPFTSMAASSTINDVSIDITSAGGSGSGDSGLDVVVTTDSDMYHLDKVYDIDEPDGDFRDIDRPTLVVCIKAVRWQYKNDKWYFINESGDMVTGWINWKSKWYYCGDDGAMYTNTTTPDGYKVGSDGAWVE